MKKIVLVVLFFILSYQLSYSQKKIISQLIDRFLSNKKDSTRSSSIVPIPVLTYAQESGLVVGAGVMNSFFVDKADLSNRSSNVYLAGSVSTKKQFTFSYSGDFWTKGNGYHIISLANYRKFSNNFYGIGNQTFQKDADNLMQYQFRSSVEVEKLIAPNVYLGPTLAYENYKFNSLTNKAIWQDPNLKGKEGGQVLYLGLATSYDNRNNSNYPTNGMYHRLTLQYAPDFFKHSNFTGFQVKLNTRAYYSLTKKVVLAGNIVYNGIYGNTPFYLLQALGNDMIMRAYYSGRFRDKNLIAGQAELRYRFMNRFSLVGFAATGQVYNDSFSFQQFKPNYGAGVRYFFDINKDLSIRLDYGVGEKRPGETRQKGFYFSMSEAF